MRPACSAATAVLLLTALLTPARPAAAQEYHHPDPPPACLGPDGRVPRVITLLHVAADDAGHDTAPIPSGARPALRLLTESVGHYARALLGAEDGGLPPLQAHWTWGDLQPHLDVVVHRDGAIRWMAPADPSTPAHPGHVRSAPLALLARALDTLIRAHERFEWPEGGGVPGDSIALRFAFTYPAPDGDGGFRRMPVAHAAPIAAILVADQDRVEPLTPYRIRSLDGRNPFAGRDSIRELDLVFTVDSTGRVVEGSVRVEWPPTIPEPTGIALHHYREYLADVTRGVMGMRFRPARVGRCRLTTRVVQPLSISGW